MYRLAFIAILFSVSCSPRYGAPPPKEWDSRPGGDLTWEFTEQYGCFFDDVLERREVLDSDDTRGRYKYLPLEGDAVCDVIVRSGRPYRIDHTNAESETWWYSVFDPETDHRSRLAGSEIDSRGAQPPRERQLEVLVVNDSTWSTTVWPKSGWRVASTIYQELMF